MAARFAIGDAVQTPFGKGVVREVRNNGRLLIDVHGRALVVEDRDASPVESVARRATSRTSVAGEYGVSGFSRTESRTNEVDLHGMTVEDALARVEDALNAALLADVAELRVIHGRSGGRIRAALHRRLREIPSVRGFRLDPQNEGVTIVRL